MKNSKKKYFIQRLAACFEVQTLHRSSNNKGIMLPMQKFTLVGPSLSANGRACKLLAVVQHKGTSLNVLPKHNLNLFHNLNHYNTVSQELILNFSLVNHSQDQTPTQHVIRFSILLQKISNTSMNLLSKTTLRKRHVMLSVHCCISNNL